jgi:hypothetical protein
MRSTAYVDRLLPDGFPGSCHSSSRIVAKRVSSATNCRLHRIDALSVAKLCRELMPKMRGHSMEKKPAL